MLTITIPDLEYFDSSTSEFFTIKGGVLKLEHSLVSLSLWESKWNKPFLSDRDMTVEESLDYIKCMTLNEVDETIYFNINDEVMNRVIEYIKKPMTATTFSNSGNKGKKEIITNEIIYYWMCSLGIPIECENWHLSRLLTLIRVCSEKNAPKKKMSRNEQLSRQRALNMARRKELGSKG